MFGRCPGKDGEIVDLDAAMARARRESPSRSTTLPASEEENFVAMLDRAGVYFSWYKDGAGFEIVICPNEDKPSLALRGVPWGASSFHFDASGTLIYIEVSGD